MIFKKCKKCLFYNKYDQCCYNSRFLNKISFIKFNPETNNDEQYKLEEHVITKINVSPNFACGFYRKEK